MSTSLPAGKFIALLWLPFVVKEEDVEEAFFLNIRWWLYSGMRGKSHS
jgi:hypothetical protein